MRRLASILLLLTGCATLPPVSDLADPHGHRIAVHGEASSPYHVKDLTRSEELLPLYKGVSGESVFNPSHTLAAAIGTTHHQFFGYGVPVIVLLRGGRPFATFVSKTWPNRPMGELAWLDDRRVCFDLFAGENMGWHYVVDAESGRAVFATPFADQ